jgi:hydroxymethylpyrimidine/phosphomethylpyrimidine kinase
MINKRPFCLSIAGYDPTAGAGVIADVKTFEMFRVYGMAIITSNTLQTDDNFQAVQWLDIYEIKKQIEVLFSKYDFNVLKIGLVQSFDALKQIILLVKKLNPVIQIVWDPILKSSSGFDLHSCKSFDIGFLEENCTLITPNWNEFKLLWGNDPAIFITKKPKASILIKGGHRDEKTGSDLLYFNGEMTEIEGLSFNGKSKHGTGCVLSAAISACLANGNNIIDSCTKAKKYVEQFILSNETNLGYHYDNQ